MRIRVQTQAISILCSGITRHLDNPSKIAHHYSNSIDGDEYTWYGSREREPPGWKVPVTTMGKTPPELRFQRRCGRPTGRLQGQ
ncbi:MAG: hypothetical protein ACOC0D_02395 [Spirochaeta sp.]